MRAVDKAAQDSGQLLGSAGRSVTILVHLVPPVREGARMSRRVQAALVGSVMLLAGCGASTGHSGSSSSSSLGKGSAATSQPAGSTGSIGGAGVGSGGVVFKASGPAVAQALDVDVNNQTYNAMQAVPLPWTTTVPEQAGFKSYALRVQSAISTPPLTCEIDVPGQAPVKLTANPGQNVVTCQAG